jgi:hypothetical protein
VTSRQLHWPLCLSGDNFRLRIPILPQIQRPSISLCERLVASKAWSSLKLLRISAIPLCIRGRAASVPPHTTNRYVEPPFLHRSHLRAKSHILPSPPNHFTLPVAFALWPRVGEFSATCKSARASQRIHHLHPLPSVRPQSCSTSALSRFGLPSCLRRVLFVHSALSVQ